MLYNETNLYMILCLFFLLLWCVCVCVYVPQEGSRAVVMAIKVTQGSHTGLAVVVCWRALSACAVSCQALTVDTSELWTSEKARGDFLALKYYNIDIFFSSKKCHQQACLWCSLSLWSWIIHQKRLRPQRSSLFTLLFNSFLYLSVLSQSIWLNIGSDMT